MFYANGVYMIFLVGLLAYALMLIGQDQPLPTPMGMYYFQPGNTGAILAEGRRLDEKMMLVAAERKQQALAAAEAALQLSGTQAECEGDADATGKDNQLTTARGGTFSFNYSRGLMVYELVFDAKDQWLERIVDRVQLWNKLFLRQRATRNWRVSLLPGPLRMPPVRPHRQLHTDDDEVAEGDGSAAFVRAKAIATATAFLETIMGRRNERGPSASTGATPTNNEELTEEEVTLLADMFLKHDEKGAASRDAKQSHGSSFTPVPVHVFLAADNGTYSGVHELTYIYAAMRYKTRMATPKAHSASYGMDTCVDATFGFFKRPVRSALTASVKRTKPVPVLAVTTGIYVTRAAACTAYILSLPMFDIQSITFMGTAGVSPVVGGGGWAPSSADAAPPPPPTQQQNQKQPSEASLYRTHAFSAAYAGPQCQREWSPTSEKVAIGSVCVTYAALLQECGVCTEETPVASLCSRPQCKIQNSTTSSGPCSAKLSWRNRRFAESMKGAMMGRAFPPVPPTVKVGMSKFWASNEAMPAYGRIQLDKDTSFVSAAASSHKTAKAEALDSREDASSSIRYEYLREAPEKATLLNCAEVDTSQILAGVRSDVLCREYAHALLHHEADGGGGRASDWPARKRQLRHTRGATTSEDEASQREEIYPRDQLTCVQAMEGFGFLHALLGSQFPHIPAALVRAGSNYNMYPLRKVIRPVDLDGYQTRDELLASLKKSKLAAIGSNVVDSSLVGKEDAAVRSDSVGAAGNSLRKLVSQPDTAKRYVARELLRRNALDVIEAKAKITDSDILNGERDSLESEPAFQHVGWEQNEAFMPSEEYEQYTKASYGYAVETASAVVLNYFLRDDGGLPGRELVEP